VVFDHCLHLLHRVVGFEVVHNLLHGLLRLRLRLVDVVGSGYACRIGCEASVAGSCSSSSSCLHHGMCPRAPCMSCVVVIVCVVVSLVGSDLLRCREVGVRNHSRLVLGLEEARKVDGTHHVLVVGYGRSGDGEVRLKR
jgi:hypothetical protein